MPKYDFNLNNRYKTMKFSDNYKILTGDTVFSLDLISLIKSIYFQPQCN